jgi:hypothetical protein
MRKLSTQTVTLSLFLLVGLFWQCEDIPPVASRLVYVSADQNDMARRVTTDCAFRYNIVNTFKRLNNDGQRAAIRAGFDLWQKVNPNLGFLELPERSVLVVKFVDPSEIPNQTATSTVGLVRGAATVTGGLRKESNGTYTILLSDTYDWSETALTKAIAYHAGLFMGMATSTESASLMSTLFVGQSISASKADSASINKLYATTCKDLTVSYLPLSLTVGGPATKTIKFDKQGTISIKASGQMTIGELVGTSGPEGRAGGFAGLSFDILGLSIVPNWNHAVLMYKLNNEPNWRNCGKGCDFSTNGLQYVDLMFNINDADLKDDIGGYDVVVDYVK